ncbi:MAG: ATP-grasp fold amidoligase family protein, partial [Flavobacteriaceae bacterium]
YVEEKVGKQYLTELYGVYYKVGDINFDLLPEKFVMKGAHGYNFNILVPNKSKLNKARSRLLLLKWMTKNQYYRGGLEWAYKNVKPKIIAEEYLKEEGKSSISDYKYFFFNGMPKFIQVDMDRAEDHVRAYVNMDWQILEFDTIGIKRYDGVVKIPKNHEEMTQIAIRLAKGFPFVRVDLYNVDGRIVFGEMTFYPTDGRMEFYPDHYNEIIGNYLQLPDIPKGEKYIS